MASDDTYFDKGAGRRFVDAANLARRKGKPADVARLALRALHREVRSRKELDLLMQASLAAGIISKPGALPLPPDDGELDRCLRSIEAWGLQQRQFEDSSRVGQALIRAYHQALQAGGTLKPADVVKMWLSQLTDDVFVHPILSRLPLGPSQGREWHKDVTEELANLLATSELVLWLVRKPDASLVRLKPKPKTPTAESMNEPIQIDLEVAA